MNDYKVIHDKVNSGSGSSGIVTINADGYWNDDGFGLYINEEDLIRMGTEPNTVFRIQYYNSDDNVNIVCYPNIKRDGNYISIAAPEGIDFSPNSVNINN